MNLSSGYPLWFIRNGLPYDYPKLTSDCKTEVAVMGGGISGALMAYHLRQAGMDVVVVDGRTIGLGSTCASTSLIQYELDIPLSELAGKIGADNAVRAYRLCVAAVEGLRDLCASIGFSGYTMAGSIYCAAGDKHIPRLLAEMDARLQAGIEVQWIDGKELREQYGVHAPAAIISKPAAKTDAYMLTHTVLQAAIRLGVQVYDRTYVNSIANSKGYTVLKTAEGRRITCRKLVYASGYEAVKYIRKNVVRLCSTYAAASEQVTGRHPMLDQDVLLWNTADPYLYARGTADHRLVIGGRDDDFVSDRKRDQQLRRKTKLLQRDAGKLLPDLPFRPEFSWAGTFGITKDSLPYIGTYEGKKDSYFALGFGGNGITFSYLAAQMVTGMIQGKKDENASLFSFNR